MKTNHLKQLGTGAALFLLTTVATIHAQEVTDTPTRTLSQEATDSLAHYLELAARNNPLINSDFMLYKASLEKVPQAGAYPDPELEIGFFLTPMEIIGGKQMADFTLMQMFPWFGTRKAARNEATEMARMAYEKFRESRNNLYYEIKSQWYQLSNLNEQEKNVRANISLLHQLEQLALNRFAASSARGGTSSVTSSSSSSAIIGMSSSGTLPAAVSSGGGMTGMGGGASASSASGASSSTSSIGSSMSSGGMSGGGMGGSSGMGSGSGGGMSDVLRIQLERAGLENDLENLHSAHLVAEAKFNTLLNRTSNLPVTVPDSLQQRVFRMDESAILDSILTQNPMLTMLEAEGNAYRAKAVMDKRMSYPMIGIGLQYSLINKVADPMGMPDMNGKDMVMPMLKISLPLFRRKYNAQQRESKNYWMASELKRDNAQNLLQAEYISVRQQLEDAARKANLYTRQYALSLSTWQLIVREFSAGAQSLTDVIQVERQMLDYQLKRSEAIAAYNITVAGIEKLISTSLNPTIQ